MADQSGHGRHWCPGEEASSPTAAIRERASQRRGTAAYILKDKRKLPGSKREGLGSKTNGTDKARTVTECGKPGD